MNAAASGSIVKVCPGGYPEQVLINKPLTWEGFVSGGTEGAFILPPTGGVVQNHSPYSAQVLVQNTTGVTITNLIVDGANSAPCGINYLAGIVFHNASGTVSKVAVHNQAAAVACGGYGVAALVDNGQAAQKLTLQNNVFRNQTTIAIYESGTGLTLNTLNNFIAGPEKGATVGIMYYYATGAIQGNTVTDEVYPQATFATPSVLDAMGTAVCCATAAVTGNMITNTQLGIAVGCEFSNGPFASNSTITQTRFQYQTAGWDLHLLHRQQDHEQHDRGLGAVGHPFQYDIRRQRRKWKYGFRKHNHGGVCGHSDHGDGYEHCFGKQLQRRGRFYAERRDSSSRRAARTILHSQ